MEKKKRNRESGYVEVEAAVILPLAILSVLPLPFSDAACPPPGGVRDVPCLL